MGKGGHGSHSKSHSSSSHSSHSCSGGLDTGGGTGVPGGGTG